MKICPRLLIFELLDDFSILLILLFLDRYFGVFDLDLRASPSLGMFSYGVPPGGFAQFMQQKLPYNRSECQIKMPK